MIAGVTVYRWKTEMLLLYWVSNAAYFFVALQIFRSDRLRQRFIGFMTVFGALLAIVSTVQSYTAGSQIFWLFQNSVSADIGGSIMGPFLNRNHFAAFMEIVLPMAMYRALMDRHYGALYAVAAGVMYAAVIASSSRTGAVLVTAEVLTVLTLLWRRGSITVRIALPAVGGLALCIVALVLSVGYQTLWFRLTQPDPYAGRREFLLSSVAMAKDHLWSGVRLGTWATVYPAYALFDDGHFANQAHNDWAQWLVEGGIPMLVLMAVIAGWAVPKAVRSVWGIGAIAVLVHSWVDYPLQRAVTAAAFFVLLGALANLDQRETTRTRGNSLQ
jgi:O-antigen ligase